MRFPAMMMVMVAIAGCASSSQPAVPVTPAAPAPAPVVATSPAPAAVPAAAEAAAANGAFHPPAGYRAERRGEETVYCTKIKPIGSNLTKTACFTQTQLEEVDRRARGVRQDVQQKQKAGCASTSSACGGT
jgi:hypothetical protein